MDVQLPNGRENRRRLSVHSDGRPPASDVRWRSVGTGSEVTPNAIVTVPGEQLKVGIVSRHLIPKLVFLDPELTVGLPPMITAATGMDAFTHALESYISNKANPVSDTLVKQQP